VFSVHGRRLTAVDITHQRVVILHILVDVSSSRPTVLTFLNTTRQHGPCSQVAWRGARKHSQDGSTPVYKMTPVLTRLGLAIVSLCHGTNAPPHSTNTGTPSKKRKIMHFYRRIWYTY